MKNICSLLILVILALSSQHTIAVSKAYDEELMVTIIEEEPCFYLKDNKFNNQKKENAEFVIDIYEMGSNLKSLLSEKRFIKTPHDEISCFRLNSFDEELPQIIWQKNTPYSVILSDGTTYYSEFCIQDNRIFSVESIPDPNREKNATKQCRNIEITEQPKKHNRFINWILNLFGL